MSGLVPAIGQRRPAMTGAQRIRDLVAGDTILMPGVCDALTRASPRDDFNALVGLADRYADEAHFT